LLHGGFEPRGTEAALDMRQQVLGGRITQTGKLGTEAHDLLTLPPLQQAIRITLPMSPGPREPGAPGRGVAHLLLMGLHELMGIKGITVGVIITLRGRHG